MRDHPVPRKGLRLQDSWKKQQDDNSAKAFNAAPFPPLLRLQVRPQLAAPLYRASPKVYTFKNL